MTDTIINASAGLLGALIGGLATIWAAWYTLKRQSEYERQRRSEDAEAERERRKEDAEAERDRRKEERREAQLAHDRKVIRMFKAEVLGLGFADDDLLIFEHLRALRRIMTEYSDLLMEKRENNQEFYGQYLANLPLELRMKQNDLLDAKRAVGMLEHPELPTS